MSVINSEYRWGCMDYCTYHLYIIINTDQVAISVHTLMVRGFPMRTRALYSLWSSTLTLTLREGQQTSWMRMTLVSSLSLAGQPHLKQPRAQIATFLFCTHNGYSSNLWFDKPAPPPSLPNYYHLWCNLFSKCSMQASPPVLACCEGVPFPGPVM